MIYHNNNDDDEFDNDDGAITSVDSFPKKFCTRAVRSSCLTTLFSTP